MRCPFCKNTETQVIDSRVSAKGRVFVAEGVALNVIIALLLMKISF